MRVIFHGNSCFFYTLCVWGWGVRGGVKPMRNNLFRWFSEDSSLNWLPSFTYIRGSLRFYGTNIHSYEEDDSNILTPVRKVIPKYSHMWERRFQYIDPVRKGIPIYWPLWGRWFQYIDPCEEGDSNRVGQIFTPVRRVIPIGWERKIANKEHLTLQHLAMVLLLPQSSNKHTFKEHLNIKIFNIQYWTFKYLRNTWTALAPQSRQNNKYLDKHQSSSTLPPNKYLNCSPCSSRELADETTHQNLILRRKYVFRQGSWEREPDMIHDLIHMYVCRQCSREPDTYMENWIHG